MDDEVFRDVIVAPQSLGDGSLPDMDNEDLVVGGDHSEERGQDSFRGIPWWMDISF